MLCSKIVVIGPGLMGSSLYKTIFDKKLAETVTLIVKNNDQISHLQKIGINATTDYLNAKQADLIIICTPLHAYKEVINNLLRANIATDTAITDIGSVKHSIAELFDKNFTNFIPSHPIAGSHISGVGSVVNNLYQNKNIIITCDQKSSAFKLVQEFWQMIGMRVVFLNDIEHDNIYAQISHLVQKIAFSVGELLDTVKISKKLHLEHFNRFIRVTSSNKKLWTDIFNYNQKYLLPAHQNFIVHLDNLIIALKEKNNIAVVTSIKNAQTRLNMTLIELDFSQKNYKYLIFAIIVATALTNSVTKQEYFNYAGSGFQDMVSVLAVAQEKEIRKYSQEVAVLEILQNYRKKFN